MRAVCSALQIIQRQSSISANLASEPWPRSRTCHRDRMPEVVMSEFLRRFAQQFSDLNKDNLQRLNQLYTHDVQFTDPLHEVQGLVQLRSYFEELYANVSELRFDFHS